jgi:hypothetical chaperone protein
MWHKGTPHFGRGVKEEITKGKPLDLPLSYFLNICSWEKMNFLDTLRMRLSIEKSYKFSGNDPRVKNLMHLIGENLGYEVFKAIEKAKIDLTHEAETSFAFHKSEIEFSETITESEFSEIIAAQNLGKIGKYLEDFLAKNQISPETIDDVFLTGGTSQVKAIRRIFGQKFGEAKLKSGDNFNSVAIGLAYSYAYLESISA